MGGARTSAEPVELIAACADVSGLAWQPAPVGFYITLRDAEGAVVRGLTDPLGGTFDAAGDFDELLGSNATPRLNALDAHADTALPSGEMASLAAEVDALLATIPETRQRPGRRGTAWRGLVRFQAMVERCAADSRSTLLVQGD